MITMRCHVRSDGPCSSPRDLESFSLFFVLTFCTKSLEGGFGRGGAFGPDFFKPSPVGLEFRFVGVCVRINNALTTRVFLDGRVTVFSAEERRLDDTMKRLHRYDVIMFFFILISILILLPGENGTGEM